MNAKMLKACVTALAVAGLALTSRAFDASTVAFYPFDDAEPGASATDSGVRNAAGATYNGTATTTATATVNGSVTFSPDAPAKYIFSGQGGVPVATNVQSLLFNGTMTRAEMTAGQAGANVSFADLGRALSALDEYTVEFFWKCSEEDTPGLGTVLSSYVFASGLVLFDGTKMTDGATTGSVRLNLPEYTTYVRTWFDVNAEKPGDVNALVETVNYNAYSGWKVGTILDGKWHHLAITHSKTESRTHIYGDYTNAICPLGAKGVAVENETITESKPLDLGNYVYRGKIACLRVTSRVLPKGEFLRASNAETYFTDLATDTVCHWRFEGTSGESVVELTNAVPVQDFYDVNPGLFFFPDNQDVRTYTGNGTALDSTYTNELPSVKQTIVCDGDSYESAIGENTTALCVNPATFDSAVTCLKLPAGNFRPFVTKGLTVEAFFRFDVNRFKEIGAPQSYPSEIVFRSANASGGFINWYFWFDFAPGKNGAYWGNMRPQFGRYYSDDGVTFKYGQVNGPEKGPTFKLYAGDWVHLAVVLEEGPTSPVKVYLDHELWFSGEIGHPCPERYSPDVKNFQFGTGACEYDELRITKRALQPSEFLHLMKPKKGMMMIVR